MAGPWNPVVPGFPQIGQTLQGLITGFNAATPLQSSIAKHMLSDEPYRITVATYDRTDKRIKLLTPAAQISTKAAYDRGSFDRRSHGCSYFFLSKTTIGFMSSSSDAYDAILRHLLPTRHFRFENMRDLHNFLAHLKAFALRRNQPADSYLLMLRKLAIIRPRGEYAEKALGLMVKCTNVEDLYLHYCYGCLNKRSGPGRTNSARAMKKW